MYAVDVVNVHRFFGAQVAPARNDADDGGGDKPTTATPHSNQQTNTHRDQYPVRMTQLHSDIGNKHGNIPTAQNRGKAMCSPYAQYSRILRME